MAKSKLFTVEIDGVMHRVKVEQSVWSGAVNIEVNGQKILVRQSFKTNLLGLDQTLRLGETEAHLVIHGYKSDLAVDGVFIESRKPYVPMGKIPAWAWIFVVANIAIPIIALGGAIPMLLGFLGLTYSLRSSTNTQISVGMRILACLGITASMWAVMYLIVFMLYGII